MSLLTICQDAADELEIIQPTSIISNSNAEVAKLLRLANKVGRRLMKVYPWQVLTKETTFTSTATEEQSSILAADFDRFIAETFFNRTDNILWSGPVTPVEWQGMKANVYSDSYFPKFRYRGGSIFALPTPNSGLSMAFEYVSKNWCQSSGSVGQTAWAADDDTGIIDEELMTLALIYQFLVKESLPAGDAKNDFDEYFGLLTRNDQPDSGVMIAGDIFGNGRHFDGVPPVSGSENLF